MGQATATAEEIQPEHAEKEVSTPVAMTYTKPNKQSLVPPELPSSLDIHHLSHRDSKSKNKTSSLGNS